MSHFMARKKQLGGLPHRKPNRHRLFKSGCPPLVYPKEIFHWSVPKETREGIKAQVRQVYQDACARVWEATFAEIEESSDVLPPS